MQHLRLNPNKFLYLRAAFRDIDSAYKDECCKHSPEAIDLSGYEKLIEEIGRKMQSGELKASELDRGLIDKIYNDVSEPVQKEFGKKWIDYNYKEPGSLVQKFKKNLWQFSCAKTLTQLEYVNSLLLDKNGRVKPEHLFKADLKKANVLFNYNYLNAEYQTAKRGAQMAHLWNTFKEQAHIYPNLVYRTVGDERVRPEHEILNGTVKPIDDPFWKTYYPPNGWRCRCTVMNTSEPTTKGKKEDQSVLPEFKGNTAIDEEIFSSKGNFFKLLNKDFKAKENTEYMKYNMEMEVAYHSKNKKKVFVSPFADPSDLKVNVESAMVIVDNLKMDVSIRAHLNVQKHKNPEYYINGLVSDLKYIDSVNGVTNAINSAKEQFKNFEKHSLVIDISKTLITPAQLIKQLNNKITKTRGRKIQELIFVCRNKAILLTREDIIKQNFDSLNNLRPTK